MTCGSETDALPDLKIPPMHETLLRILYNFLTQSDPPVVLRSVNLEAVGLDVDIPRKKNKLDSYIANSHIRYGMLRLFSILKIGPNPNPLIIRINHPGASLPTLGIDPTFLKRHPYRSISILSHGCGSLGRRSATKTAEARIRRRRLRE